MTSLSPGVAADPDLTDDEPPQVAVSVDGTTTTEYATGAVTGDGSVTDYAFDLIVPAASGVHHVEVSILSSGSDQPDQAGSWTVDVARPRPDAMIATSSSAPDRPA